jgi:hypothetical protein
MIRCMVCRNNITNTQCLLKHMLENQLQKPKLQKVTWMLLTNSTNNIFKGAMVLSGHIINQLT